MKIYFAGIAGNKNRLEYLKEFGANKLMLTFADVKYYNKQMDRFKANNFDILFDSGAFSMWRKGIDLSIIDYCSYLKKHNIDKYLVLDKIGDFDKTMDNQHIMEDEGLKPIPVFHMSSPITKLDKIVQDYDYVCLGGSVGQHRNKRIYFFQSVFTNFPNYKFHGLGVTDASIIKAFPFYSVDSTTWLIAEKNGQIFGDDGRRVSPRENMCGKEKFKNTITYFVNLEKLN